MPSMNTMSDTATRRRNGKVASCEPCRKGKLRCDHQRPTCARCRHRGIQSRCTYHPAPMTKGKEPELQSTRESVGVTSAPLSLYDLGSEVPITPTQIRSSGTPHKERLKVVKDIIKHLRHYSLIEKVVKEYCLDGQASLLPSPLLIPMLTSLYPMASACGLIDDSTQNETEIEAIAARLLLSTSEPIEVDSSISVADYISKLTGQNLRLEIIGVIYSIAARACTAGLSRDIENHDTFIQNMFDASSDCRRIARDIAPLNDSLLWLDYDAVLLASCVFGHSSENVWRRLGDLSDDVIALGIHRESFNATNTPFFLADLRRKTFWRTHQLEFYDRPPRITSRYADCELPLDLTDDELCADPPTMNVCRQVLTADGWNPGGTFTSTAWTRVRHVLSIIRENTLEYNFKPTTSERHARLKDLAARSRDSWNWLPARFRYTPGHWDSDLQPSTIVSLTEMRLKALRNDLTIHKLIERCDPSSSAQTASLSIAAEIITILLELGNANHRAVFVNQSFRFMLLVYGLPSIAVLTTALRDSSQNPQILSQASLSKMTLIQKLSVCIYHLENLSKEPEIHHEVCTKASKHISRVLEETLEPSKAPTTRTADRPVDPALNGGEGEEITVYQGAPVVTDAAMTDLDLFDTEDFANWDMSAWINNLEYTGAVGDWTAF